MILMILVILMINKWFKVIHMILEWFPWLPNDSNDFQMILMIIERFSNDSHDSWVLFKIPVILKLIFKWFLTDSHGNSWVILMILVILRFIWFLWFSWFFWFLSNSQLFEEFWRNSWEFDIWLYANDQDNDSVSSIQKSIIPSQMRLGSVARWHTPNILISKIRKSKICRGVDRQSTPKRSPLFKAITYV